MKRCSKCGQYKERPDFYIDLRKCDGLRSTCKSCVIAVAKDRYYLRQQSAGCEVKRHGLVLVTHRQCTKCRVLHPNANFTKSKKGKNGIREVCRKCRAYVATAHGNRSVSNRKYYLSHKQHIRGIQKYWERGQVTRMSDRYLRKLLVRGQRRGKRVNLFPVKLLPNVLVDVKRLQLGLKRQLKQEMP